MNCCSYLPSYAFLELQQRCLSGRGSGEQWGARVYFQSAAEMNVNLFFLIWPRSLGLVLNDYSGRTSSISHCEHRAHMNMDSPRWKEGRGAPRGGLAWSTERGWRNGVTPGKDLSRTNLNRSWSRENLFDFSQTCLGKERHPQTRSWAWLQFHSAGDTSFSPQAVDLRGSS